MIFVGFCLKERVVHSSAEAVKFCRGLGGEEARGEREAGMRVSLGSPFS